MPRKGVYLLYTFYQQKFMIGGACSSCLRVFVKEELHQNNQYCPVAFFQFMVLNQMLQEKSNQVREC